MKAPPVIVPKTPGRDFLQGESFEDHFAARLDHLDGLRSNGCGASTQQQFLHRDTAGFLHQRDSPRATTVRQSFGTSLEHGPDGDNGQIEKTSDS